MRLGEGAGRGRYAPGFTKPLPLTLANRPHPRDPEPLLYYDPNPAPPGYYDLTPGPSRDTVVQILDHGIL